jgi:hypothetical protein
MGNLLQIFEGTNHFRWWKDTGMEAPAFSNDSGPVEPCNEITSFAIIKRWQSNHSASPAIE